MNFYRCEHCYWSFTNSSESISEPCPHCNNKLLKLEGETTLEQNLYDYYAEGNTNFFSLALGRAVENAGVEEKIMAKKGFIKETKLDKKMGVDNYVDKWIDENTKKEKIIQERMAVYTAALTSGKSMEEAMLEAFPAEMAISGQLDYLFDKTIITENNNGK